MTKTAKSKGNVKIKGFGLETAFVPKGNLIYHLPTLLFLLKKGQDDLLFKLVEYACRGERNAKRVFSSSEPDEIGLLCSIGILMHPINPGEDYTFHQNAYEIVVGSIVVDDKGEVSIANPVVDKKSGAYHDIKRILGNSPEMPRRSALIHTFMEQA